MRISSVALNIAILLMTVVVVPSLQAPTAEAEDTLQTQNETTISELTTSPENLNSTEGGSAITSCPRYNTGNPKSRNSTGCITGTALDVVDHELAFGFHPGSNPDWASCDIRELPQANERICYKTTVDLCGLEYRIHLNRRNENSLRRHCPLENDQIPGGNQDRFLQSPRYGCRKGRGTGSLFNYRRSEMCLYNISIPNCESGWLTLGSASNNDHQIEERMRDQNGHRVCVDYLQIFYGNSKTEKFCGNDLTLNLPLTIPTTQFLALFWTDPFTNDLGFKLQAKCRPVPA